MTKKSGFKAIPTVPKISETDREKYAQKTKERLQEKKSGEQKIVPKKTTKKQPSKKKDVIIKGFALRIPSPFFDEITDAAEKTGRSKHSFIINAIKKEVKKRK